MNNDFAAATIFWKIADEQRGNDELRVYLRKLRRTLQDILANRPVQKWRLDRLQRFFDEVAKECLRQARGYSTGCF